MPGKIKLTPEIIVDTAIELIENDGLENLSTRALGKQLGVQAMALYYHVPSKDALLDRITGRLAGMIEFPEPSEDWRGELELVARSYIGIARRFPRSFALLAARRFNTPETLPVLEGLLVIFKRAGLPPAKVASCFRILGYFLSGAGMAQGATMEADRRTDFRLPDPEFLAGFPVARETVPHLSLSNLDSIFETGLGMILDFVEDEAERLASRARHS